MNSLSLCNWRSRGHEFESLSHAHENPLQRQWAGLSSPTLTQGASTSSTISQWSPLAWRNTNIEANGADSLRISTPSAS